MPTTSKKHNPFYQAQAILSRRDQSEHEMRTKLARKGFLPEQIEEVVTWLYKEKLLDDTRYAKLYVESKLLGRPVGPRYLVAKLKERGVAGGVIEQVLAECISVDQEVELVSEAVERWKKSHEKDKEDKQKLWRYLAGRGFSPEAISRATS